MNKYQTGNKILPTAQYASIKYDRGTKHIYPHFVWDSKLDPKKDIRGVRANNPLHSEPGEIMREILYSPSTNQPVDTTYREYPTALLPVKIQTRVASSNDQDRKEYETLKRRFNTAWNVSRPHIRYGMFKNGGLIPKYQYGGNYLDIRDNENYWNNYLANTGYKAKYTEVNPLLGLLWPFGIAKNTYADYRDQYTNAFYNKLEKDFNNQVPRSTLIQNPLINKAFERNFNIWWKNQNFGAMIPETSANRIYKGDGSNEGKDLNSTVQYRPGYIYDNGWIKININDSNSKTKQKLNSNPSTEPKNRKFKINPNFDISKFKKNGGIIKALNGIKIVRKTRDGRYEIISNDDKGYFFDPSTQLLTDNKGNQGLFTTYDLTQLFKVNPEFAKNLVDAGYSFTKSGAAGDHNTTDLVQVIYNSYVPKKNITESTNVNERPTAPPAQVVPPVQSSQQGFTPEQFFDTLFGNQEYAKKFKQFLGIPDTSTESETTVKQPEVPTYESLVRVNTASMNDNINNGNFRRQYRKAFNEALLNGTIYGANNPNGTLVFDSNAVMGYDEENGNPIYATADNIMQKYGLDGKISRRDMRMLRKDIIKNQNQVRINNVSNFLGITSPAVVSPTTEEVVSTQSGVYQGATPEETANQKQNYDWSKTI